MFNTDLLLAKVRAAFQQELANRGLTETKQTRDKIVREVIYSVRKPDGRSHMKTDAMREMWDVMLGNTAVA